MIRVLIAEDMHMIRSALVALLSLEDDMEVVAEIERGDEVLAAALRVRPDVAVLDIDMPGLDGHYHRRDRRPSVAGHRAQLPVQRDQQGRGPQPHRRHPHLPRRGLALTAFEPSAHGSFTCR